MGMEFDQRYGFDQDCISDALLHAQSEGWTPGTLLTVGDIGVEAFFELFWKAHAIVKRTVAVDDLEVFFAAAEFLAHMHKQADAKRAAEGTVTLPHTLPSRLIRVQGIETCLWETTGEYLVGEKGKSKMEVTVTLVERIARGGDLAPAVTLQRDWTLGTHGERVASASTQSHVVKSWEGGAALPGLE